MKLLLNNEEVTDAISPDATLGVALATVQESHIAEDHVVSAVWIDGEPLTAERLSTWKDRPVSDFSEARIDAPLRNTLASEGLRMIAQGLGETAEQREQIVDDICQGRTSDAMTKLTTYLDVWNTTQQTTASVCRLLCLDVDTACSDSPPADLPNEARLIGERIGQLTSQLQELKSALQASDLVLVGDILDYEFGNITENWREMLEKLADHFGDSP